MFQQVYTRVDVFESFFFTFIHIFLIKVKKDMILLGVFEKILKSRVSLLGFLF